MYINKFVAHILEVVPLVGFSEQEMSPKHFFSFCGRTFFANDSFLTIMVIIDII